VKYRQAIGLNDLAYSPLFLKVVKKLKIIFKNRRKSMPSSIVLRNYRGSKWKAIVNGINSKETV
jgi:hypothetical protein